MALKIYRYGRYIVAQDTETNEIFEAHADKVLVTRTTASATRFGIVGLYGTGEKYQRGIDVADLQDENGDPYTAESFWTWATENTGNFKTSFEVPGESGQVFFNKNGAIGSSEKLIWDDDNSILTVNNIEIKTVFNPHFSYTPNSGDSNTDALITAIKELLLELKFAQQGL
jgi:hypothetical protein